MAISPEALDAMVRTGASASMIAEVVKADLKAISDAAEAAATAKRCRAAEAKKRQRAALRGDDEVHQSPEDLRGQRETYEDIKGLVSPKKDGSPHPLEKTTPSPSLRSDSSPARSAWFAELWSILPHRSGDRKQPAEEKFYRLVRASKEPEALANGIIAGAKAYAASKAGADLNFVAASLVWLNQSGWNAEYSAPPDARPRDGPAPRPAPVNNRRAALTEILDFAHGLEDR